jgi:hypothetical protein
MPTISFLPETGVITKDGEQIAHASGSTVTSCKVIAPRHKSEIKGLMGVESITWQVLEPEESPREVAISCDYTEPEPVAGAVLAKLDEPKPSAETPPPPPLDPRLGWHTPGYPEWAKAHAPEIWAKMKLASPCTYGGNE